MLTVQRNLARRVPRFNNLRRVTPHRHISHSRDSTKFDEETDVIIVGSGGAGLLAALRCSALSLRSIIVEKTDKIGGTTALSGGAIWVPNNAYHKAMGENDSPDAALEYMNQCIGEDAGPASSASRRLAFVQQAPRMLDFLREIGFQGRASGRLPNYYPDLPGGHIKRSVESALFDARKLGRDWRSLVRRGAKYPPVHTEEATRLFKSATSLSNMLFAAKILGLRGLGRTALGQLPVTMGYALVCQLLHLNLQQQQQRGESFDLRLNSPLKNLILDNEGQSVIGGVVHHDGAEKQPVRIRARRGVLLVAGGFARNAQMRQQHQEGPISDAWTSAQEGDTGDAILIGTNPNHGVEAQVALMDDAWWGPSVVDPRSGARFFLLYERALPHSIIVDSGGERFMNEAEPYTDACHAMYSRNRTVPSIPSWLILDATHRRRYPLASLGPGLTPTSALESGFVHKGATLDELAGKIGVPPTKLSDTVERFNAMARRGRDDDFGRGGNEMDRFLGDHEVKPNANLGPVETAPFYALKVWPGDLGTKGGLLTDEHARVINTRGSPVRGLYAAGNTTASVMGRSYAGSGATLGPALTFSYIAVNHMAHGVAHE